MTAPEAVYIVGDSAAVIADLPDASVDLILTSPPFLALRSYLPADHPNKHLEIGSEPTPAEFLDVLLTQVDGWSRVLAPHGSIAIELGDTYSGSGGAGGDYTAKGLRSGQPGFDGSAKRLRTRKRTDGGQYANHQGAGTKYNEAVERPIKGSQGWPLAKSMCGIPHLFHLSLAYGRNILTGRPIQPWRVRNVVAWCRPNPPVGALGDKYRPATSYLTIATKSQRRYFDLDAVRQPPKRKEDRDGTSEGWGTGKGAKQNRGGQTNHALGVRTINPAGAPPLDWWEIPTQPYKGSHYATWPEKLLERPILSMVPERVCTTCGKPSERIVDGWTDCGHNTWRRGIVLDPFAGTFTTAVVANRHGRTAWGIDLDDRNAELATKRVGEHLEVLHHAPDYDAYRFGPIERTQERQAFLDNSIALFDLLGLDAA